MNREELLEFMAETLGVNVLDTFIQGVEDQEFDPARPYRGKLKFEDLPEMTRMLIEMNEHVYAISDAHFRRYMDESLRNSFIVTYQSSTTGL